MKHLLMIFLLSFSLSSAANTRCTRVPSEDLDSGTNVQVLSKSYTYLGTLKHQCWYFRDIAFKNGHGQQAVVVASNKGKCVGLFRTSLANRASLVGAALIIETTDARNFKVDLSRGIPHSIFFDGEVSNFEQCNDQAVNR